MFLRTIAHFLHLKLFQFHPSPSDLHLHWAKHCGQITYAFELLTFADDLKDLILHLKVFSSCEKWTVTRLQKYCKKNRTEINQTEKEEIERTITCLMCQYGCETLYIHYEYSFIAIDKKKKKNLETSTRMVSFGCIFFGSEEEEKLSQKNCPI